jgi:integrase
MAQASILTENDVRRVFRIIETTRHAERNRLAFVLSIYAGLRVGEIAALRRGRAQIGNLRARACARHGVLVVSARTGRKTPAARRNGWLVARACFWRPIALKRAPTTKTP